MNAVNFLKYLLYNFPTMPFVVQLSLVIISLAITLSVLSYIIMGLFRYHNYTMGKRQAILSPQIADLVFLYISPEDTGNTEKFVMSPNDIVTNINRFIRNRGDKQVMVNLLIEHKKNLRGTMGEKLTELFIKLALDKFSLSKLQRSRAYKKIQGLTELSDMGVTTSDVYILPLTRHKSHQVRTIARHAYIKVNKNNPFKFLDSSGDKLLIWDQIELFRIITADETSHIPDIAPWLTYSANPSVVLFCLRLVVQYNQRQAIPAVINLLDSRDHTLRCAVINCLGKMRVTDVEQRLVGMYTSQPVKCRIEIIKALGRIKTGKQIDFLKQEFTTSNDFSTRKNAAKSLVNNLSGERIEHLLRTSGPNEQLMIRYCMNPMIKYV